MHNLKTIDDFRIKLVSKIISATSQQEIKELIFIAIQYLEDGKVNAHLIVRFIEKTLFQLQHISLSVLESQMVKNINFAKKELEDIRKNKAGNV